jgi:Putative metallopeptidase
MKRVTRVAATVAALIYPALHGTQAGAQAPADIQNPQIEIAYVPPGNSALAPIYDRLKNGRVLEQLKQFLAPLKLSRKLTVQFEQCGAPTRPYKSPGPATICYELVDRIEQVAAKAPANMRQSVVVGTVVQAALHEVAHGVFDILQVPVWGRRNDAADMLAGLIMLQFGEDVARQTIIGTAAFFELSGKTWTGSAFADVNSPEAQRYFNYLCIAYGGKRKSFEFLAKADGDQKPVIPEHRAVRCEREYEQIRKAFNLRIMPYVDPDLLVRVRSMQWLAAGAAK